jgi:hypothetical protein
MTTGSTKEALVLSDADGNIYAIPRDIVEAHRVTPEQKAQLEELLGDDVSGYTMYQQLMTHQHSDTHLSEMRQKGAEARMAKSAQEEATQGAVGSEAKATTAPAPALRAVLTGIWMSLPFVK